MRCDVVLSVALACLMAVAVLGANSNWSQYGSATPAGLEPVTWASATAVAPDRGENETPTADAGRSLRSVITEDWLAPVSWRPIGPATMGGRIVALAVDESNPFTFYVATASGGLFKTTNNGTTFQPVFERESTVSIGDVAIAASDPNIVWVGTGEHNPRNSVSWGDGVYKSTDGGQTWQHMGLKESFQIGRIAIHPTDPDIVYVGALGRLWGTNEERGVYKTTDGGETWEKILYVDEKTGCTEVRMHPDDPDTLLVAMYERQRGRFDVGDPVKRWGPGSGIYKTTDGGATWTQITQGLPDRPMGRIGIDYYRTNPDIVYAIVETDRIGTGPATAYMGISGQREGADELIRGVIEGGPADRAGIQDGDRILEIDGKEIESYNDLIVTIRGYEAEETSTLKIERDEEIIELEITWGRRPDGANPRPFTSYLGGQRANAQDEQGRAGNQTGGVYRSTDGGESWERVNSLNPRPFYYSQVRVDPNDDQYIYVLGIQFHFSTNGGQRFRNGAPRVHVDHHDLWVNPNNSNHMILGCDGGLYLSYDRGATWDFCNIMDIGQFYDVGVDTQEMYWVYGGLQDNGSWGGPSRKRGSVGPVNDDWVRIGGGDGFVCRVDPEDPTTVYYESQYGRMSRLNTATGARQTIRPESEEGLRFRFNWKTPFMLSHHNSKIFYAAGNYVFRSLDRGNDLRRISPRISATNQGTATALSESPLDPNVLYVGTDDGYVWITRDGGNEWENVTELIGLPDSYYVTSIEASRFAAGRAYVAFDGHRSDNDDPHLYVTEDFGQTWREITSNLPAGSTHCLREDVQNANVLYCGTEFAIWVSVDRGEQWLKLNNNLPTVAIHEIAVHPTQNEIVAATHGRSIWILDVTPLRQVTGDLVEANGFLFVPNDGVMWAGALTTSTWGHRHYFGQNPAVGSQLYYHLNSDVENVSLEILDVRGQVVRRLQTRNEPGLHRVRWDLRRAPTQGRRGGRGGAGPPVEPGVYLVQLTVDGAEMAHEIHVQRDPDFPEGLMQEELEQLEEVDSKQRALFVE